MGLGHDEVIGIHTVCTMTPAEQSHSDRETACDVQRWSSTSLSQGMRHDTIRYAVLTCARKPIWVGLIYRTETTTRNCKTEKLKSTNRCARSDSRSLGNRVVSPEEERERLRWEGFVEKVLSLEWKREWVMKKLMIISVTVSGINDHIRFYS